MAVHVYPLTDLQPHTLEGNDCLCDPYVEYLDQATGLPHPHGPLVLHNCFCGPNQEKIGWAAMRINAVV